MITKVAKKLEVDTKAFIAQAVKDIISDPDFGLELSKKAEKRLRQVEAKRGKTSSLSDIKKKYY